MPRSRMIKPELWDDEKLASVSRDARLTFVGLWTYSDDFGVVKGHPEWLRSRLYPYDGTLPDFTSWLSELEGIGVIRHFEVNGESFFHITNFLKHQVINRPSKQRNPEPPLQFTEHSLSTHGILTDETETETETETESNAHDECTVSDTDFEKFWSAYPKKRSKGNASKVWKKLSKKLPPLNVLLNAIEKQKKSKDWLKEDGQFIPYPASWLNAQGWEDQINADCKHVTEQQEVSEFNFENQFKCDE